MSILSKTSAKLIADLEKSGALPKLRFKSSTSMASIAQSFASAAVESSSSCEHALESMETLEQDEVGKMAKTELDAVGKKIAEKINMALKDINAVMTETDQVLASAAKIFESMSANDPVMNKFMNLQNFKIEFKALDWNKMNDFGSETSLILGQNMSVNDPSANKIELSYLSLFCNHLPFTSSSPAEHIVTIPESKDFTAFLGTVKSEKAAEMGAILTNEDKCMRFISEIMQVLRPLHGFVQNNSLNLTAKYLDYIQAFGLIRDTVSETATGFGNKEYDSFLNNCHTLEAFLNVLSYFFIGQRRTLYQDMYILPNGMINPDNQEAFTSAGLTTVQANNSVQYYREILGNIPGSGLSVERIKNETEMVDNHINNLFTSSKFDANRKTMEYRASALRSLLEEKISLARTKGIRGFSENSLRASLANEMEHFVTNQKTDHDVASDFLMSLYHPYEMSEDLLKKLKKAYLSSIPDFGKVTTTDLKMIETKVIATTVADFMKKSFF